MKIHKFFVLSATGCGGSSFFSSGRFAEQQTQLGFSSSFFM